MKRFGSASRTVQLEGASEYLELAAQMPDYRAPQQIRSHNKIGGHENSYVLEKKGQLEHRKVSGVHDGNRKETQLPPFSGFEKYYAESTGNTRDVNQKNARREQNELETIETSSEKKKS